jgi:anti-anti-sigma regulatory factor
MSNADTDTKKVISSKRKKRSLVITADNCLDITIVHELHDKLCKAFIAQRPVTIDASQVERADTAALQMLCAFFRDSDAEGSEVKWKQPSEVLCNAARLLNLDVPLKLSAA